MRLKQWIVCSLKIIFLQWDMYIVVYGMQNKYHNVKSGLVIVDGMQNIFENYFCNGMRL